MSIGYLFTLTSRAHTHRANAFQAVAGKDKPAAQPAKTEPAGQAPRPPEKPAGERRPR